MGDLLGDTQTECLYSIWKLKTSIRGGPFCHILTYFDLFWPVLTPLRIWLLPSLHQPLPFEVSVKSWGSSPVVTGPPSMLAAVKHFGWLVISLSWLCNSVIWVNFVFGNHSPILVAQFNVFWATLNQRFCSLNPISFWLNPYLPGFNPYFCWLVQSDFFLVEARRSHIFDAPSLAFSTHMFAG